MNNLDYRFNENNKVKNLNKCLKIIKNNGENISYLSEGCQGSVYKIKSHKCGVAVLKKYFSNLKNELNNEILFLKKVKKVVDKNVCPNFIYYYTIINNNIIMEYADGNIQKLLKESYFSNIFYEQLIMQILFGISVMKNILHMVHYDLKFNNIFYKKILNSKYKYFIYNTNNHIYYLQNNEYLFLISDFGRSKFINSKNKNIDFKNILNSINININIVSKVNKLFNKPIDFINKYKLNDNKQLKQIIIDDEKKLTNNQLIKKIIYYSLENNLVYLEEFENFNYFKDDTRELFETIFSHENLTIEEILNKYFKKYQLKPKDLTNENSWSFHINY
jgi:hypothetical protein